MARTQSKKRRLLGSAKSSNPTPDLALPTGRSQARARDFASVPETSGMTLTGKLRHFFHGSKQGTPTTTTSDAGISPSGAVQEQHEQLQAAPPQDTAVINTCGGDQERQEGAQAASTEDAEESPGKPEPESTPALVGKDVDAAVNEFDGIVPMPPFTEGTVDGVGAADATFNEIQHMSDTYLKPFKVFNQVATTLSNVHPYVQAALGILTSVSQLFLNQANLDNAVSSLLETVRRVYEFLMEQDRIGNIDKDTLAKIARTISDSAHFVKNYSATKSFWKRTGKHIFSETRTVIDGHTKVLENLMQQCRDHTVRDVQINTKRIFEDLNLEGMAYADGAGLNTTKKCLDGTRTDILREIMSWINDPDVDAPRILWLHGQAGRGKSAIAHTIASWIKDVGGLGSCFCFARDRQAERREEKILTTIARDLADRDPAFRHALADAVSNDRSLRTTPDVMQQWQRLILDPLSKIDGTIVGNVVVVIDALDESGSVKSRKHILSFLTSTAAARLPPNFRILLTSRPLLDIERLLSAAQHVRMTSLDDISTASAESDIQLYVFCELAHFPEIGTTEVQNIARKSDGLFEWARLACEFIEPNKPGRTIMERYSEIVSDHSGDGGALLDIMYRTILEDTVPKDRTTLARFRSVMRQIVSTFTPLRLDGLNGMRSLFPSNEDRFDMMVILEFMAPLLSGITDKSSVVRPLHASFYDYLLDHSRSEVYFIGTSMHSSLAFASLHGLCNHLKFNICGLENSYSSNTEVADLEERINTKIPLSLSYSCQYWAHHLQRTAFDSALAALVKAVIESERMLFWLETLSLLSGLQHATDALTWTATWLQGQDGLKHTLALAQEGIKFLQMFGSVISHSTPHLYISALPFVPSGTMISRMLRPKFSCLVGIVVGGLTEWPVAQVVMWGHAGGVTSVGFSFDGKKIVSGSTDKTVRVWDAGRGVQIHSPFEGHTNWVNSVKFSSDGKRIVSGSDDKTVRVWDAERGVQVGSPLVGHTGGVNSVDFSSDGKRIVSGSNDNTVRIWDAQRCVQIGSPLRGHTSWVNSVEFSPTGKRIVSGSFDTTVRVWDAESGVQIGNPLVGHTAPVKSVGFSSDGMVIVSGSSDKTVRVWDAEKGVQIGDPLEGHTDWVNSVGLSPDGRRIVSGADDNVVRVWDAERGVQIHSPLVGHTGLVKSVGFSPDRKRIVSGSSDNTVRVWDAEGHIQVATPPQGYIGWVRSVAFSHDGKKIVSSSNYGTMRIWDVERGVQVGSSFNGSGVTSVAFSFDGEWIVTSSFDKTVKIWDAERGVQVGNTLVGHSNCVNSARFSSDGKRIVSGSDDKSVRVWDAVRGAQVGSPLLGHTGGVRSVEFSSNGKRIASGSNDNTVRVWDAERGILIGDPLAGHTGTVTSIEFSSDGKKIVSGSADNTVRVWDAERGVQIGSPLVGHTGWVQSVGFSLDGKRIVSGSDDNTVRIWDAERSAQVGSPLKGHTRGVSSVDFSSDGKRIVSGSNDQTVRVWDVYSYENCKATWPVYHPDGIPSYAIDAYPICFSSVPSHALHDTQQLLDGIHWEDMNVMYEPVKFFKDGWIRGPKGKLLLWVPPAFQKPFYSMWNRAVLPRGICIELDLSQMVHGNKWHHCFKPAI